MENRTRPEDIAFEKVLTDQSQYALVFTGTNNALHCPCVIKMVVLRRLAHYDQDKKVWINEKGKKDSSVAKYFLKDGAFPFLHTSFAKHKSMTMENFKFEVRNAKMLSKLGLGATFFTTWIERDANVPVEYGFIAVEKGDCTIKDLILKKAWRKEDIPIVKELIRKLHKANIVHRDNKPSSTLCWLDKDGKIKRVAFIDCAKVRTLQDLGKKEFKKKLAKEFPHFKKHILRNIKQRKKNESKKS